MAFDTLFIIQHYVLYRHPDKVAFESVDENEQNNRSDDDVHDERAPLIA